MRNTCSRLVSRFLPSSPVLVLFAFVTAAYGQASFGPPAAIDASAGTDGVRTDYGPDVATDGAGTWISAWISAGKVVAARSTDGGMSWEAPVTIDATGHNWAPARIATDGGGTWIVVWESYDSLGGVIGTDSDILFSRSNDGGTTWSASAALNSNAASDSGYDRAPAVAASGTTWIAVWQSTDSLGDTIGTDQDILMARSVDGAATWSLPAALNSDAATEPPVFDSDEAPAIAASGGGTWIVVWEAENDAGKLEIGQVRSDDDGASWSAQTTLSKNFPGANLHYDPQIATDGSGRWVAAWEHESLLEPSPWWGSAGDIVFATSSDDGLVWTDTTPIHPYFNVDRGAHMEVHLATDGIGTWFAMWRAADRLGGQFGFDKHIFFSYSLNDAETWSLPAVLPFGPTGEPSSPVGYDARPRLAMDASSTAVAVWGSTRSLGGALGSDADVLRAVSRVDCPSIPAAGCKTPRPGKAKLSIAAGLFAGRGNLKWKWSAGQASPPADFEDPTVSSEYLLCVYDASGAVPSRVFEQNVAPGSSCSGQPCWQEAGTKYRYRNRDLLVGPVKSIVLKAGEEGKARIVFKAKGPTLAPPLLPLSQDASVVVQLHNLESGVCWEAVYSTSKKNTDKRFKAVSD